MMSFTKQETEKIQDYLRNKFGNEGIALRTRKTNDSLEVLINGEFIAVIYKDEEDGDISYDLNMAILSMDLDE
ncbi:MAG: DUF3126 family protein [Alphaproteobacteria bacterium]|jgi:hypothetical protein|nr:DUF3126 family protein [Alphaproteobacteria bacterium]MDP7222417.1 DUF3126 family protein [Alphaproteobacteria bacterium]